MPISSGVSFSTATPASARARSGGASQHSATVSRTICATVTAACLLATAAFAAAVDPTEELVVATGSRETPRPPTPLSAMPSVPPPQRSRFVTETAIFPAAHDVLPPGGSWGQGEAADTASAPGVTPTTSAVPACCTLSVEFDPLPLRGWLDTWFTPPAAWSVSVSARCRAYRTDALKSSHATDRRVRRRSRRSGGEVRPAKSPSALVCTARSQALESEDTMHRTVIQLCMGG